jgi:hypothetical protein
MKVTVASLFAIVPVVGIAVFSPGATTAEEPRSGALRVMKECTQYSGAAGAFCTITSSNIPAIPVGARVIYDQAAGIPANMLDSNVVLDAGNGNWALGRCTLDLQTGVGLCTFADGTGRLAGFEARVDVAPPADGINWSWLGTYQFNTPGRVQ